MRHQIDGFSVKRVVVLSEYIKACDFLQRFPTTTLFVLYCLLFVCLLLLMLFTYSFWDLNVYFVWEGCDETIVFERVKRHGVQSALYLGWANWDGNWIRCFIYVTCNPCLQPWRFYIFLPLSLLDLTLYWRKEKIVYPWY